jgi:hypothetical protein
VDEDSVNIERDDGVEQHSAVTDAPPRDNNSPAPTDDVVTEWPAPVLGPHQDPVFPSLPAPGGAAPSAVAAPTHPRATPVELDRNIYTLTPGSAAASSHPLGLDEFDQPEKDRIFRIATELVENHVRRIEKAYAIKNEHEAFRGGTLVVSVKPIPKTKLRHARFQWAIANGRVFKLEGARLPVGHLAPVDLHQQPSYPSPHRGDDSDLAFLLAYLCDLLGIHESAPIAATGKVALETNNIVWTNAAPAMVEAARASTIKNVVLPHAVEQRNAIKDGLHDGVRYWSVRDTNEALFALMSASVGATQTVTPQISRRAFTKQAYSWLSLILVLTAVCCYQLAVSLDVNTRGHPPVNFVRVLLIIVAVFLVGSETLTHRYWKLDR